MLIFICLFIYLQYFVFSFYRQFYFIGSFLTSDFIISFIAVV